MLGLFLGTAAITLIFIQNEGNHFVTAFHGQLGLAVFILGWLQAIGGVFRPHVPKGMEKFRNLRKICKGVEGE
jgi:hypothetical protein